MLLSPRPTKCVDVNPETIGPAAESAPSRGDAWEGADNG